MLISMRRLITVAFFLLALLPSGFVFWHAREAPHLGAFQDDSLYVTTAKSLAEGRGYRILSLPGEPYMTKYPPLYPFLLSLVWRLDNQFPQNLRWVMLIQWLIWLAFLTTLYLTARFLAKDNNLLIHTTLLLAAVAPAFVYLSASIMAESLFAALVLTSIVTLGADAKTTKTQAFWAGCAAGAAFLTKSAALPLIAAGLLSLALRKRWVQGVLYALPTVGSLVAWRHWTHTHRLETNDVNLLYYLDYVEFYKHTTAFSDLLLLVNTNVSALIESVGRLVVFTEHDYKPIRLVLVVVGMFASYSTVVYLRRTKSSYIQWFFLLYCIQSLLWNYPPNERFLFPLLIVFIAGSLAGVKQLLERWAGFWVKSVLLTVWIVTITGWGASKTLLYLPTFVNTHGMRQQRIACFADWARDHIAAEDAVVAYRDADLYLYSGVKGIRLQRLPGAFSRGLGEDVEELLKGAPSYATRTQLRYLVWDRADYYDVPDVSFRARMEKILGEMNSVRLEAEVCGVRLYRFERGEP